MTINDGHLEKQVAKTGDQKVDGAAITKSEDSKQAQRQEIRNALETKRLTVDKPFQIDMGNGKTVDDARPLLKKNDKETAGSRELIPQEVEVPTGDTYHLGKDGKTWVKDKDQHHSHPDAKADHEKHPAAAERGFETVVRPQPPDEREASLTNTSQLKWKPDLDHIPRPDLKDGQGHITQKNYADGRHTDIHYDKNGQPDEIKTPDGQSYKKHIGKDGKPDGTWDVSVPKDKSPDGKEHHYNAKIDIKVDGDGAVSWTTKAGEHSKIDKDGKWHKDVIKEDSDALHTDLSKQDLESAKKLCDQVNKDGDAEDVYKKLLKEHPEDKDKVHLVTKFDEHGKMRVELAPGPDPMENVFKQGRIEKEAKELDTALGTRDLGASAQAKLDEINKTGDGRGVYDKLSDSDKKMVHLETVDGKEVLKLGEAPKQTQELEKANKEARELSQDLFRLDDGASAKQMVKSINEEGNAEAVYNKLSDPYKQMVHLEEHNGVKTLVLGAEAPPEYNKEAKADNTAATLSDVRSGAAGSDLRSDATGAAAEAAKISEMMEKVNSYKLDGAAVIKEMQTFARTHASEFEAMCHQLEKLNPGQYHVDKNKTTGAIKVTYGGFMGINGTTLYDGIPGPNGNGP